MRLGTDLLLHDMETITIAPGKGNSLSCVKMTAKCKAARVKPSSAVAARRAEAARAKKGEDSENPRGKSAFDLLRDRQAVFESKVDGCRRAEIRLLLFREVEKALAERCKPSEGDT